MRRLLWWLAAGAASFLLLAAAVVAVLDARAERRQQARADWARVNRPAPEAGGFLEVKLRDGRRLAYRETGDPAGAPLLYFHGAFGSRLEWPLGPVPAGLRVIAPDRPGYGYSDPSPGRSLTAWAEDIEQFANALGLARFRIAAWSAGTPYALACAARMPARVTRLDLVASFAPFLRPGGETGVPDAFLKFALFARRMPGIAMGMLETLDERRLADAAAFEREMASALPPADRKVNNSPAVQEMLPRSHAETFRQGVAAVARDVALVTGEWGFSLADAPCSVVLWHGSVDASTPPHMAEHLAARLPSARLRLLPGEGHFLLFPREREILAGQ